MKQIELKEIIDKKWGDNYYITIQDKNEMDVLAESGIEKVKGNSDDEKISRIMAKGFPEIIKRVDVKLMIDILAEYDSKGGYEKRFFLENGYLYDTDTKNKCFEKVYESILNKKFVICKIENPESTNINHIDEESKEIMNRPITDIGRIVRTKVYGLNTNKDFKTELWKIKINDDVSISSKNIIEIINDGKDSFSIISDIYWKYKVEYEDKYKFKSKYFKSDETTIIDEFFSYVKNKREFKENKKQTPDGDSR